MTCRWLCTLLLAAALQDPPEVEKLGSDDLSAREKASADLLRRLDDTPALAEVLEARLARERDPEVRARLDTILTEAARRRAARDARIEMTEAARLDPVRGRVHRTALTPDGSRLATIGTDERVFLFDVRAKRPLGTVSAPSTVQAIAWSPDGARIAVACEDTPVQVWDAATLKLTATLKPAGDEDVPLLLFHPSGRTLAALSGGSNHGRLLTADLPDGEWQERLRFREEKSKNQPLGWRADGRFLNLTLTPDSLTLKAWDFATGEHDEVWKEPFECDVWRTHLSVNSDRTRVAVKRFTMERESEGPDRCVVWDLTARKKIADFDAPGWYAHFKDPETVVVWAGRCPGLRAYRIADGRPGETIGSGEGRFTSVQVTGATLVASREDGTVALWSRLQTPEAVFTTAHAGRIRDAVLSPDGSRLVIIGEDRTLRLWSTDPAKELARADIGEDAVCSAFLSADGRTLALSTTRGVVLYDAATLAAVRRFPSRNRPTNSDVVFSPDGKTILIVDGDLWQHLIVAGPEGDVRRTLGGPGQSWLCVQFSPDGRKILALKSGKAVVLDAETLEETAGPDIGRGSSIAFAGDSGHIVSLRGANRQLALWDLATGRSTVADPEEPGPNPGGGSTFRFLRMSGRMIAGLAGDNTVVMAAHAPGRANRIIRIREIKEGQPVCLSMSGDGRWLAFATWRRSSKLFVYRIDQR